jgi:hypothetical protein
MSSDPLASNSGKKARHESAQPPHHLLLKHYLTHPHQLVRFLMMQRVHGFEAPIEPHLDDAARALFADLLSACTGFLEFGSGGSTRLADRLEKKTLTVESDRFFSRTLRGSLKPSSSVTILDVDIGLTGPWSNPIFDWPTARRLKRWSQYVRKPFDVLETEGWFPDFVFVDGRFRRACALQTARSTLAKERSVKLLFDDYFSDGRAHYHSVEHWLGRPERVGRAALFVVDAQHSQTPSVGDIDDAVSDYR